MVQREHLLGKYIIFIALMYNFLSCTNAKEGGAITSSSFNVDTRLIPNDTILSSQLVLINGIYHSNKKPFSGYRKELHKNDTTSSIGSYLNGMQHGVTITYFENGKLKDSRAYKANKSFGKHYGFWPNGNQKFEFYYLNDKRVGFNKQWYESGAPYAFLNFKDDKEHGMQQAWRENGKPYINYEARDGYRYGLQKSGLCYTLKDEKFAIK